MSELTKSLKKEARGLIGIAYTRELNYHLNELSKKFNEWRNNKLDCWDLNDLIHRFHDGISRDLYKMYNYNRLPIFLVSRAVVKGFLHQNDLSKELLERSSNMIQSMQEET